MRLSKFNIAKKPRRLVHDLSVGEVKPVRGTVTFEETKGGDWIPVGVHINLPDLEYTSNIMGGYPRFLGSTDAAESQQIIAAMREIIAIVDKETK